MLRSRHVFVVRLSVPALVEVFVESVVGVVGRVAAVRHPGRLATGLLLSLSRVNHPAKQTRKYKVNTKVRIGDLLLVVCVK